MNIEEKHRFFNELGFFTLCNAAPAMGKFLKDTITISSPKTRLVTIGDIKKEISNLIYSKVVFNNGEVGNTHVLVSEKDGMSLAKYVIKQRFNQEKEDNEWDEFAINSIEEIVNILGGNMTEILSVAFGKGVMIDVPELYFNMEKDLYEENEELIFNEFTIYFGDGNKIKMMELASQAYYNELLKQLRNRV